jgi:hypothetical protein
MITRVVDSVFKRYVRVDFHHDDCWSYITIGETGGSFALEKTSKIIGVDIL